MRTQDVLDENETVLVELNSGSRLIEVVDPDAYRDRFTYRLEPIQTSPVSLDDERRAKLWIALYAVVGDFRPPSITGEHVPVAVALEGTPALATYLYAVAGFETEKIADVLDVSRRTVWDYWSDLRRRAANVGVDP